jgi:cell division protein FtsW
MSAAQLMRDRGQTRSPWSSWNIDLGLLIVVTALICWGLVMVASASVSIAERQTGEPLYYFYRQLLYTGLGVLGMALVYRVRLVFWENAGIALLLVVMALLVIVLVPGIGKSVNGARRWLALGAFNLQVSELAKLLLIIYFGGYLVRHGLRIRASVSELFKPLIVLSIVCVLLLLEPDYGAAVVLIMTVLGLLFLSGVRLWLFGMLILGAGIVLAILATSSTYRIERITTFLNPWADPYNNGFQLTQALIAIGNGSWFGLGLGESIQKMLYLPEAHTDFLFSVLAEELGMVGVFAVIALYSLLIWRCFAIGNEAEHHGLCFGTYLCYGIGMWLGLQAFINMGVNMGLLPTKGLTLPMMSAGGSSMLTACIAIGVVFRVQRETLELRQSQLHSRNITHKVMA